jgi:hypothetical protein
MFKQVPPKVALSSTHTTPSGVRIPALEHLLSSQLRSLWQRHIFGGAAANNHQVVLCRS